MAVGVVDLTLRGQGVVGADAVFGDEQGQVVAVVHFVEGNPQALGVDLPAPVAGLQIGILFARQQVAAGDRVAEALVEIMDM